MACPLEESSFEEQRSVIRFLLSESVQPSEIFYRMNKQYGSSCMNRTSFYAWVEKFKCGCKSVIDENYSDTDVFTEPSDDGTRHEVSPVSSPAGSPCIIELSHKDGCDSGGTVTVSASLESIGSLIQEHRRHTDEQLGEKYRKIGHCCVRGCTTSSKMPFHKLPRNNISRQKWLERIHREDLIGLPWDSVKNVRVCFEHFSESDYLEYTVNRKLKNGALPFLATQELDLSFSAN
ncbi:hypothetical protein R5R35_010482 [Gryllus longicercus]|uniref:THAP-type domain-containing protein n=2 Tax=Gryllus longicercus TaxID=2509291 RepID=A0AAN9V4H2_9ORTH